MTRKTLAALLGDTGASPLPASAELRLLYAQALRDLPHRAAELEAARLARIEPEPDEIGGALVRVAVAEKRAADEALGRLNAYRQQRQVQAVEAELDPTGGEEAPPRPSQAGKLKKACSQRLRATLRKTNFLDHAIVGAESQGQMLVPGSDISAATVFEALQQLGYIPQDSDRKSVCAGIREFYDNVEWRTRAVGSRRAGDLVAFYRAGEVIAKAASDSEAQDVRKVFRST